MEIKTEDRKALRTEVREHNYKIIMLMGQLPLFPDYEFDMKTLRELGSVGRKKHPEILLMLKFPQH